MRRSPRGAWVFLLVAGGLVTTFAREQPPQSTSRKTVLVLYSTRKQSVPPAVSDTVFRQIIGDGLDGGLDYNPETLDLARFPAPAYEDALRQFLTAKYRGQRLDLLLAIGEPAFEFLSRHRIELATPETPLVFAVPAQPVQPPHSTGIIVAPNLMATLESALALHPGTEWVAVICGATALDRSYEAEARREFKPLAGRLQFVYLAGLPMAETLRKIGQLQRHSIVLLTSLVEDGAGQVFTAAESAELLSKASAAPFYSWSNAGMGHGPVGGRMASQEILSTRLAQLALRVLKGEDPASIPVREIDWSATEFDWAQLRRWGISEALLPPGSQVLFRPPNGWEEYRNYILSGALVLVLQAVFIIALLVQREGRRKVEVALRESEERFRLLADTAPVLIWRAGTDRGCDFFNRPWLEFTGRTMEQQLGDGWMDGVHPEDLAGCFDVYSSSFNAQRPFQMEYRLRRADGAFRWIVDHGVPRYDPDGRFAGYLGSCLDVTDYKEAMERLTESQQQQERVAGRLINAQEHERARIARELHDDINQQIAGLAMALSGIRRRFGAATGDQGAAELLALQQRITAVVDSIRQVSHVLHPSVLEHGGLVAALTAHCQEIRGRRGLNVTFTSEGDFNDLSPASGLCLFRVAQEALHNVVAHAQARQATVRLLRIDHGWEITVADDGKGFDVGAVRRKSEGLGLVSIQERARLAGGTLGVLTEIGRGTQVRVRIPFGAARQ